MGITVNPFNNFSGGMHESPVDRGARFTGQTTRAVGAEARAAKKFIDSVNVLSFSPDLFTETVIAMSGEVMEARVLEIMHSFIQTLVIRYDSGIITTATVEAKRMQDGLDRYGKRRK